MEKSMRSFAVALCAALMLVAPAPGHADTPHHADTQRGADKQDKHDKHDVQWIKRCDRMKEKQRFECLGEMRAAAANRYARDGKKPDAAAPASDKKQSGAKASSEASAAAN
jgi:hypothetical protein